jgi:hypothetical protein
MSKTIFLKDSNNNKYMNGDFKYNSNNFFYKNNSVKVESLDKVIIFFSNIKPVQYNEFIYKKSLMKGFNIKINNINLFEENIFSLNDFYKYESMIDTKEYMSNNEVNRVLIDLGDYELNPNEKIEVILNDDYSELIDFHISIKLL